MLPTNALKRPRHPAPSRVPTAGPLKWQPVALGKQDSASAVLRATGCALLAQLRANQAGAVAGRDAEFLHQLRVTVRRLRALFSLYSRLLDKHERTHAKRELQWLAHALGPARDSDVFIHDIWPPLREALGAGPLIAVLNAEWLKQQRRNTRTAQRALASQRCQRMVTTLAPWFDTQAWRDHAPVDQLADWDQPARKFARQALQRRATRMHGGDRSPDTADARALHRLRIEIKKLRYRMEILSPLFSHARVTKTLKKLSHLQDILGVMNDIAVAQTQMDAALQQRSGVAVDQLRHRFAAWQASQLKTMTRKLKSTWRAYRHVDSFW